MTLFVLMLTLRNVKCGFDVIKRVNISLFYGTHIPECAKFIKEQLKPMWDVYKKRVRLTLVPYGRLSHNYSNYDYHFGCQYGLHEQFASQLHSVLADIFSINCMHHDTIVRTVACLMGYMDHRFRLEDCMVPSEHMLKIRIMMNVCSITTRQLLANYGDLTKKHFPDQTTAWFPQLIFNGIYKEQDTIDSWMNLTEVVLRYIT